MYLRWRGRQLYITIKAQSGGCVKLPQAHSLLLSHSVLYVCMYGHKDLLSGPGPSKDLDNAHGPLLGCLCA